MEGGRAHRIGPGGGGPFDVSSTWPAKRPYPEDPLEI